MTRVMNWPEIEAALAGVDLIASMEEGFQAYSDGRCTFGRFAPCGRSPRGSLMLWQRQRLPGFEEVVWRG